MEFAKYVRSDGKVGVLISRGFGAGWSTWADPNSERIGMLFDSRIVQMVIDGLNTDEIVASVKALGYKSYTGGACGLVVEWVESGEFFPCGRV